MKFSHTNKGFTLIELLVVISIISLLSSIVLASLNDARIKATNVAAAESARQASLSFIIASTDNTFPDLSGTHCLTASCIIADSNEVFSTDLIAFDHGPQANKLAKLKANLLLAQVAQATVDGLQVAAQTEIVSGLPGGDFQGIFYYTPNDGEDGHLYYPIRDSTTCLSGYVALSDAGANGVLCGEKIGEPSDTTVVDPFSGSSSS